MKTVPPGWAIRFLSVLKPLSFSFGVTLTLAPWREPLSGSPGSRSFRTASSTVSKRSASSFSRWHMTRGNLGIGLEELGNVFYQH